ncbi:MAG: porphobilinogen synthase, partial [Henriciella sp.]
MTTPFLQSFPATRLRRLRQTSWIRNLTAETQLSTHDLIWSLIVHDGEQPRIPVQAMPGVDRLNVDEARKAARRAIELGIPAVAIFPHIDPALKTQDGRECLNPDGLVPRIIRAMKQEAPDLGIICDVALDPFTSHGHDGLIDETGYVLNDETSAILVEQAIVQAKAGADIVAPSDMMDGRVGAIRAGLDAAGFGQTMILSYAAKYASGFYGPYREAIGSATALVGDKKTYQQNPANSDEALREVALDIAEGADMVMVKPGLPYLDIVRRVSETFSVPTIVFQVSGEYAMIEAAAE